MKKYLIVFVSLMLLASNCEDPPEIEDCLEDACYMLSDLNTNSNHFLPFILHNDIDKDYTEILLNGEFFALEYGKSFEFTASGFYELKMSWAASDQSYLFTLGHSEREPAEWGIPEWVPAEFTAEESFSGDISAIYPRRTMAGIDIPFIFYASLGGENMKGYLTASTGDQNFFIKHGVGSVLLKSSNAGAAPSFTVGGQDLNLSVQQVSAYTHELGGNYETAVVIPENSIVHVTEDVFLSGSSASLEVGAGSLILVDEGINIYHDNCPIDIQGSPSNPVLVTCAESGKYWGGFLSGKNEGSADFSAVHTIFCRSGYHDGGEYDTWGHARRQGLFYTSNSELSLEHCYMTDHIGQIFYPRNAILQLDSILVQRAKTSGQLNFSQATISNSIFTDFPDDSYVYQDEDNDALYIYASDVTIDQCIFMFAKDDGMDSGGDLGGTVSVSNTLFEACFHEGSALSSKEGAVKSHSFENCTFYNCGQGLELGFSGSEHSVIANNCKFLDNGIGIRYGDNYQWSAIDGTMTITNSQSLGNIKDVWNMVRLLWAPKSDHLILTNVQVSQEISLYPDLEVIGE